MEEETIPTPMLRQTHGASRHRGRINGAYMGQHMTAVAFKGVIKAFYGQSPKFSYMVGCSGGGGQTLMEAERFPADFDGFSIGAPPLDQTVHDLGFWHGWEYHVNARSDGSIILAKEKLSILHDAVITHCTAVSGIMDNELQQPTVMHVQQVVGRVRTRPEPPTPRSA